MLNLLTGRKKLQDQLKEDVKQTGLLLDKKKAPTVSANSKSKPSKPTIERTDSEHVLGHTSRIDLPVSPAESVEGGLKRTSSERNLMQVKCLNRELQLKDNETTHDGYDSDTALSLSSTDKSAMVSSRGRKATRQEGELRGEFEVSLQASGEEADKLDQFFRGVDSLKRTMAQVKATTRRLQELHRQTFGDEEAEIPSAAEGEEGEQLREAFSRLVKKNESLLATVRERAVELRSVELTDESFRKLKHNIMNGINMKAAKLLLDYRTVLNDHNQRLKELTWRQLKEQQLDERGDVVSYSGGSSRAVAPGSCQDQSFAPFDPEKEQVGDFMQKFVFREKVSEGKRYLEEKHRDLEIIERNMMELNELMRDFSVMVESANEPLDQIETYLKSTKANMEIVEENLRQAKYTVVGMRKKKLITAIGIAVVVIVVVAVVVGIVCLVL